MGEKYWEQFCETGRVTDYLYYKGMDICRQVMKRNENVGQTGETDSESDYGDRYGAKCSADRGI